MVLCVQHPKAHAGTLIPAWAFIMNDRSNELIVNVLATWLHMRRLSESAAEVIDRILEERRRDDEQQERTRWTQ